MILDGHRKVLADRGISIETALRAGIRSGSPPEIRDLLGYGGVGAGMVIPFGCDDYVTVRLDEKRQGRHYRLPKGKGNRLYCAATLPPGILDDPGQPLYVTEGPLKALAATQAGFPCVAMSGVNSWRMRDPNDLDGATIPIPDLDLIKWDGRPVTIVFDQDIKPKTVLDVRKAERALADELEGRGAHVSVIRLPVAPGATEKMGLDDYLVAFGPDGFAALPRLAPDHDDRRVDETIRALMNAADLDPRLKLADPLAHKALDYALVLGWTRHSLTVPLYGRKVSEAINGSLSTAQAALKRLVRYGWLRREFKSLFTILEPLSLHPLSPIPTATPEPTPTPPSYTLPSPPILTGISKNGSEKVDRTSTGNRGGQTRLTGISKRTGGVKKVDRAPHPDENPEGEGSRQVVRVFTPEILAVLLQAVHDGRGDHDAWDRRALGPQARRVYEVLLVMGEATEQQLGALLAVKAGWLRPVLDRLRLYGLAALNDGLWRPVEPTDEALNAIALGFGTLGLRARRQVERPAAHRAQQAAERQWHRGRKSKRPT
jgi:hypothetical protein